MTALHRTGTLSIAGVIMDGDEFLFTFGCVRASKVGAEVRWHAVMTTGAEGKNHRGSQA